MDILCFKGGISRIPSSISISGSFNARSNPFQINAVGRSSTQKSSSIFSRFSFNPLKSLWPGRYGNSNYNGLAIDDAVVADNMERKAIQEDNGSGTMGSEGGNGSWVLKALDVNSVWMGIGSAVKDVGKNDHRNGSGNGDECDTCRVDDDDEAEVKFDRESFSRMLQRVSLAEARLYAQMSYLGNLAYCIPKIKPRNLLRYYGLRFVTSSIEKMELATAAERHEMSTKTQEVETNKDKVVRNEENRNYSIGASAAYQVITSAASYLHAQTKSILPFDFAKAEDCDNSLQGINDAIEVVDVLNTQEASLKATTDSVKAVVAAKDEVKQVVADDLNSTCSSPCEWYICDDDESGTRVFVIQGSESLASWQANLLFEPIQFEGFDVLVHRGIYEAAKEIYQQMLPEVHAHLKALGWRATFRFTGHSLGGSLALLINLMLLIRQEVPFSSMLPVITFGAPCILCGGDCLLETLELPRSHVQAITLHRDIVSRAFSCNYPYRITHLLKAVNGKFRTHSCLNNQNILYAPMGEFLILQPDKKFSPHHDLLPPGSGLYLLSGHFSETKKKDKYLQAAQLVFLNSPHPLEILSDRSAYGSGGTIIRDHDMKSYLKALRNVIREELNSIREARREQWHNMWWPLLAPGNGTDASVVVGRSTKSHNIGQDSSKFSSFQIGKVMEKFR